MTGKSSVSLHYNYRLLLFGDLPDAIVIVICNIYIPMRVDGYPIRILKLSAGGRPVRKAGRAIPGKRGYGARRSDLPDTIIAVV